MVKPFVKKDAHNGGQTIVSRYALCRIPHHRAFPSLTAANTISLSSTHGYSHDWGSNFVFPFNLSRVFLSPISVALESLQRYHPRIASGFATLTGLAG